MKRYVCVLVSVLTWLAFSSAASHAKNLGVFGAVYAIAEKDALKEIEERAARANLKRMVNKDELASISTVPQMTNARWRVLPVRLAPRRWATG
jgi:hypothetical protein